MISINVENNNDIMELLNLIDISSQNPDHDTMEINYNKIVVTFGNVKKSLETLQKEIEELQNSSSNNPSGDATIAVIPEYTADFSEAEWVDSSSQKILKISPSAHHLGTDVTLKSILKKVGNGYEDVFTTFKVLVDGTVVVYSELAFSGRLVIDQLVIG